MDVDVTATVDETGVGAMVDATEAEGRKNMLIFVLFKICHKRKNLTPSKLQFIV